MHIPDATLQHIVKKPLNRLIFFLFFLEIGIGWGKKTFVEYLVETYWSCRREDDEDEEYAVKIEPHSNGPLWVEMHAFFRIGLEAHRANWKPRNGKPQGNEFRIECY